MRRVCWLLVLSFLAGCNENYISKKREGLRPYDGKENQFKEAQEPRENEGDDG
jgi:hypothetical protein